MRTKRKCRDCANFALFRQGKKLGECRFGAAKCVVLEDNDACKGFFSRELARVPSVPESGDAPFCGDFAKCNNAEGCDTCAEFEAWLQRQERGEGFAAPKDENKSSNPSCDAGESNK